MILAIDTSSACSSAAVTDGDRVLSEASHVDARRHAEVLAPLIAQVRASAAPVPDAVAVGVGPGPYTGLRVGIATAQALALAWQVPVIGVCSLDVMAAQAGDLGIDEPFAVASDARRREVYWATYASTGERLDGPFVASPVAVGEAARSLPWVGEGAHLHPRSLPNAVLPELRFPSAGALGRLVAALIDRGEQPSSPQPSMSAHGADDGGTARSVRGHRLLSAWPLYVRRPDAVEPGARS